MFYNNLTRPATVFTGPVIAFYGFYSAFPVLVPRFFNLRLGDFKIIPPFFLQTLVIETKGQLNVCRAPFQGGRGVDYDTGVNVKKFLNKR